nr:uncharacterized protein LOC124815558 [Hydra vulgaris]
MLIRYFNSLSSKDAQDSYLASLITLNNVSKRRPRNINLKDYNSNYKYKFLITNHEILTSSFIYVCFSAFILIFGMKDGRLETIKRSLLTKGHSPHDRRDKHKNQYNNFTPRLKNKICDCISSFREFTKPEQQLHELELQKEQHHKDAEIFYIRKRNA